MDYTKFRGFIKKTQKHVRSLEKNVTPLYFIIVYVLIEHPQICCVLAILQTVDLKA